MDPQSGPSSPKRRRIKQELIEDDLKDYLTGCNSSDDDFSMGDTEDSLDDSEEDELVTKDNLTVYNMLSAPSSNPINFMQGISPEPYNEESTSSWTRTCEIRDIKFLRKTEFFESPGQKPIDYFNLFFDDSFLEMICQKTNEQAARMISTVSSDSRVAAWKQLTVTEMKKFLGLLFHMGTIHLSFFQDYWKRHRLFAIPIFPQQMSRNRFRNIMRCLYFTSETQNKNDPLFRVSSLTNHFNEKMAKSYYPTRELCIGKSMVIWRGLLRSKQFIKNKNQKFGVKVYTLTEPNGLILKLHVSRGTKDADVSEGKSLEEKVVMSLLADNLDCGHAIYMDKSYNSFKLAKRLLEKNTYCTGILNSKRGDNPKEVVEKNLKCGENISLFREFVHVGKWKDTHSVMYITTQYEQVNVIVPNNRYLLCERPETIAKYHEFMSAIDRQDRILAYYPCEKNSLRWYLKYAIHTFQLMFINSYKLYNKYSGKGKMKFYDFRLSVISELLPDAEPVPPLVKSVRATHHKISRIQEKNLTGKTKRKVCRECSKSQKRKDTVWHCEACIDKPGLCVECFEGYHGIA